MACERKFKCVNLSVSMQLNTYLLTLLKRQQNQTVYPIRILYVLLVVPIY